MIRERVNERVGQVVSAASFEGAINSDVTGNAL